MSGASSPRDPLLKRPFDVLAAALLLLAASPLMLLVAIVIKLEDRGPVFYRQERWGRGASRYTVSKFRTMVSHSDARYGILPARENDHRITRVGKVLRATGVDELPQLVAILMGKMSFVGPRALAVGEIVLDEVGNHVPYESMRAFLPRLTVRPGLTSPATILLPKDASPATKFSYDLMYISRRSFWGDVRIILLSFWISATGRWETRGGKVRSGVLARTAVGFPNPENGQTSLGGAPSLAPMRDGIQVNDEAAWSQTAHHNGRQPTTRRAAVSFGRRSPS